MRYMKFWVAAIMTVLAGVVPALTAGPLDASGWVNIVILGAGAFMVISAANVPGFRYAKLIVAAVSAVAVVLASALTDGGIDVAEIVQMVIAAASALGVGAIPNGDPEPTVVDGTVL